ncbi:hypothetical protein B0H14DRAFT_1100126 [Mycena olivaceomarginata]|nr:hypothetical protein B0H14DRAFT_1100126 [Mycena olivaceomarginata]
MSSWHVEIPLSAYVLSVWTMQLETLVAASVALVAFSAYLTHNRTGLPRVYWVVRGPGQGGTEQVWRQAVRGADHGRVSYHGVRTGKHRFDQGERRLRDKPTDFRR